MISKVIINKRICLNSNCNKCDKYDYEVPSECEYGILHALDEIKLEWRGRRSGKTSSIIKMANDYRSLDKEVMIIFKNLFMATHARQSFNVNEKIKRIQVKLMCSTTAAIIQDFQSY